MSSFAPNISVQSPSAWALNNLSPVAGAGKFGFSWAQLYNAGSGGWGMRVSATAVNVLRYIPPAQWAGILAGTSTYDAKSDIQAALNSGAHEVYFPGGDTVLTPAQYYVTGTLTKPGTVNMVGAGAYNSAITAAHNDIAVSFTPATLSGDAHNTMKRIMVRNAAGFASSIGISLNNVNQSNLDCVRVEGCVIGIQLFFVLNSSFTNISCIGATGVGFYVHSTGLADGCNGNTYKCFNLTSCLVGLRIDAQGTLLSLFENIKIETCTDALVHVSGTNTSFLGLYLEANTNGITLSGGDNILFEKCVNVSAQQWIKTAGFGASRVTVRDLYDLSGGGILQHAQVAVQQFGQIKFPSTQVASSDANTLDDYAEGSWTAGDGSGAGLSITSNACTYTKIGREVTLHIDVTFPVTADTSEIFITGMPYPAALRDSVSLGYTDEISNGATHGHTVPGQSYFRIQGVTNLYTTNNVMSGNRWTGTCVYRV